MAENLVDDPTSVWRPLDVSKRQIRLLHLSRDVDESETPVGRLSVISLDDPDHVEYIAISYAWQPADVMQAFRLDGTVTYLPYHLLRCFQFFLRVESAMTVWVDAICINQQDQVEKGQQVLQMDKIFSRAQQVRVWLGSRMGAIEDLLQDIVVDKALLSSSDAAQLTIFILQLHALNQLSWWTRLWIRQEVALAKKVFFCYGGTTCELEKLRRWSKDCLKPKRTSIAALPDGNYVLRHFKGNLRRLHNLANLKKRAGRWSSMQKSLRLLKILSSARGSVATDVRDRVYGQMGLVTAALGHEIMTVDYDAKPEAVYTKFAIQLIRASKTLDILNQACSPHNSMSLPSWVPDWSSHYSFDGERFRLDSLHLFSATGKNSMLQSQSIEVTEQCLISLSGEILTEAIAVGLRTGPAAWSEGQNLLRAMDQWQDIHEARYGVSVTGDRMNTGDSTSVFARTMFRDVMLGEDIADNQRIKNGTDACASLSQAQGKLDTHSGLVAPTDVELALIIGSSMSRFFIDSTGRPGLGPIDTRVGDKVALLVGGRVPYILRKSPRASDMQPHLYTFVGECYLHGVMDGEAFDERNLHDITLE